MYGIDLSSYQQGIDLSAGKYEFAILKATEGASLYHRSFYDFAVQLTKLNKLIGCYHFARPDLNSTKGEMIEEAKHFLYIINSAGLIDNSILAIDWETEPLNRLDLMEAWIDYVESQVNRKVFIYASKSFLSQYKKLVKDHPTWVAWWPTIRNYNVGENPHLNVPNSEINWKIWQYSSMGVYPGFKGNVDLNYSTLTNEEWNIYSGRNVYETLSDDMKWAISIGLFKGYPNGKYGPGDTLTREQAATLFRRYFNFTQDLTNPSYGITNREWR